MKECQGNAVPENGVCKTCRSPCKTCKDTPDTCTDCVNSFYLLNSKCLVTCVDGMYADIANNKCVACISPCQTCTSNLICQSCESTHYLFKNRCVASCDAGYYVAGNECMLCTEQVDHPSC